MPGIDGGLELVTSDGALAAKLQRTNHTLTCEFSVRIKGVLGPDHIEGVKSGKIDRASRMTVEVFPPAKRSSKARTAGIPSW
jgi:16S rRNA U516 pseudouridylate synthase RsuA-like enzyme